MEKVRIGIFGLSRGRNYFDPIRLQSNAELVAVCDKQESTVEGALSEISEKGMPAVEVFNNFEDFIKYDMDAVVLCNYADDHARFAIAAMEAGKHVMCEVLPAKSPAEAVELIEAVERTGMVYFYAENYCYMKPPFEMWRRYKSGEIGEIRYAEGEYVHPSFPRERLALSNNGDSNHWRRRMHPNFYCTHSVGPMLAITGLRPKSVVGFQTNDDLVGSKAALEMVTLENGAILRSLHGSLRNYSIKYRVFGQLGSIEQDSDDEVVVYHSSPLKDGIDGATYKLKIPIESDSGEQIETHHGSDYYPTHFFVEKIRGNNLYDEWLIDVYLGVDMMLCGYMARRSVLSGGVSVEIPDFRDKSQRDKYRNDYEDYLKKVEEP